MKQDNYNIEISANISAHEASEAISQVSKWWATNFEGSSQKPGDVFTVRFGETFATFEVVEVIENQKIVWQVTDCYLHWLADKKEWKDTKIDWGISASDNATEISMTHIGLVPEIECYNDCRKGWNFYVGESLLKLMTEHKGLPETPKSARS